jgi:hypothetical protein
MNWMLYKLWARAMVAMLSSRSGPSTATTEAQNGEPRLGDRGSVTRCKMAPEATNPGGRRWKGWPDIQRWRPGEPWREAEAAFHATQAADVISDTDRVDGISNTVHPLGAYKPSDRACVVQIRPKAGRRFPRQAKMPEAAMAARREPETEEAENGWIARPAPSTSGGGATFTCSWKCLNPARPPVGGAGLVPNFNATYVALCAPGQLNHSVRDHIHGRLF